MLCALGMQLCDKYMNGHCPYGDRCRFIHPGEEDHQAQQQPFLPLGRYSFPRVLPCRPCPACPRCSHSHESSSPDGWHVCSPKRANSGPPALSPGAVLDGHLHSTAYDGIGSLEAAPPYSAAVPRRAP